MRFDWQPARGTYIFNIGVKTSELSNFLKYDYGKNNVDSRFSILFNNLNYFNFDIQINMYLLGHG